MATERGVTNRQGVLDGLAASAKYRHLAPGLLTRTADWALERHPRPSDALKAAKRKLHQVFGAYTGGLDSLECHLDSLEAGADINATCRRILGLHRSTAERLEFTEELYRSIWNHCGMPEHVLDLAAGLNAFSLPFSGLDRSVAYTAIEIDRRMVNATQRFLTITQRRGRSLWCDILDDIPTDGEDLALLFKTLPCLERQKAGAALDLILRLSAIPSIVLSYPVRSLGGHRRNMPETYRAHAESTARASGRDLAFLATSREIVAVLSKP